MTVLGLGTYRSRDAEQSARIAAAAGCPLVDTAPVYGHGAHQQTLAPVLDQNPEVRVASKVGYMTTDQAVTATSMGVLTQEDAQRRHSIAPTYVRYQIGVSAFELGRSQLDLVHLHNPDHGWNGDRDGLHRRIRAAFSELEQARDQGFISGYGVATWTGFTEEAFSVAELLLLAQEAAGGSETGLTAIQLPVSLVQVQPIRDALNGKGPTVHAEEAGLEVWASAPLHGGELVSLINDRLARFVCVGASGAEAALMVTASTPGVSGVLISASSVDHWTSAASAIARAPLPLTRLKDISDLLARADG